MLKLLAALAFSLAPAHAVAQEIGDRTVSLDQILAQAASGNSDEELARQIAAASTHPLGTLENPVRVGGPEGERRYIARLRCADNSQPKIGARAEAGVGAFGSIVGAYTLDCGDAAPGTVRLVMDMYYEEHEETRAPAGFTLAR